MYNPNNIRKYELLRLWDITEASLKETNGLNDPNWHYWNEWQQRIAKLLGYVTLIEMGKVDKENAAEIGVAIDEIMADWAMDG